MPMNIPDSWKTSEIPEDDPIYTEYEWCDDCKPNIENLAFYVRELENAQVVAKQALETMMRSQEKLNIENHNLKVELKKLTHKLDKNRVVDIKSKMNDIDGQVQRRVNTEKIIQ